MNIITITNEGVLDTPCLIENDTTAQATFNSLAEELLGEDISEVNLYSDDCVEQVNKLLRLHGKEINWFVDVEVNDYVNQTTKHIKTTTKQVLDMYGASDTTLLTNPQDYTESPSKPLKRGYMG